MDGRKMSKIIDDNLNDRFAKPKTMTLSPIAKSTPAEPKKGAPSENKESKRTLVLTDDLYQKAVDIAVLHTGKKNFSVGIRIALMSYKQ